MTARGRIAVWAAFGGMCAIWGTTWFAIKVALHALPPLTAVGLRFAIAGVLLYAVAALRGDALPPRALPWKLIGVLATVLFGLDYVLTYVAETRLDSGLVAVLFGTLPFFSFAFAHALLGERTTPRIWIGSLAAFAGVAVVSLTAGVHGSAPFALAAIGAGASAAFGNVYAKRHGSHAPLVTLPPAMLLAGAAVLAVGLSTEHTHWAQAFSVPSIAAVLYLAVFGSGIAFFLLLWTLQRLPASLVGLSSLAFPVIALAVGALFGGEHVGPRELGGSALVVAGLGIALGRT